MTIGIHSYYDVYNHDDNLFSAAAFPIGDGLEKPFVQLKALAESRGFEVHSCNLQSAVEFDIVIVLDYPEREAPLLERLFAAGKVCLLVILESEIIVSANWNPDNYRGFRRVFSWNPIHNKAHGCRDLPLAQNLAAVQPVVPLQQRKFACLMASHKRSKDARELYTTRRKIIRWYEKNASDQFDLFGFGWDSVEYRFSERIRKYCPPISRWVLPPFPSFRGSVKNKRSALSQYQFNYCLENVRDIPGYISEKIFDAMAAGCIPLYWGDKTAKDSIPSDCWIDVSSFANTKELHRYLINLTWDEKQTFQERGHAFLQSPVAHRFSADHFATTLLRAAEELYV